MQTYMRMISEGVAKLLMLLSCITLMLLAGHVTAEVLARYLFNSSLPATLEIGSHYYMVALTFLPMAYSQISQSHIAVDFVVDVFPSRLQLPTTALADILMFAFLCLFTYGAWIAAVQHTRRKDYILTQNFDLILWPTYWLLVAGLAAFALAVLVQFLAKFTALLTGTSSELAGENI